MELRLGDCYLVDVPSRRIYTLAEGQNATGALNKGTILIRTPKDLM